MKTSNYIIISFFVFLFGGIFVLFLAAKIDSRAKVNVKSYFETKDLGHFSVLVDESTEMLILKHNQKSLLLTFYDEGEPIVFAPHEIRHDTLFILKNPQSHHQFLQVECSGVKSIVGKAGSFIRIDDLQGDTLTIKLEQSKLLHLANNERKSLLALEADKSDVQISANIDNLTIQANQTVIHCNNSFRNISGTLKSYSSFAGSQVNHINLEADSTSTYQINK